MRKKVLSGLWAILMIGLISCSKDQQGTDSSASVNSIDANVTMAVASVASTQVNIESSEDIQSLTYNSVDSLDRLL